MNRALHRHEKNNGSSVPDKEDTPASPGRIVLYVDEEGAVHPAIVIRAFTGDAVNLRVFTDREDTSKDRASAVPFDESQKPGTWHWPPKG